MPFKPCLDSTSCKNPGVLASLGYVFFSIIPHATAPRYIFVGLMLLAGVYQFYKGQLQRPRRDAVTLSLLVLCVIVVTSAVMTPYGTESLSLLRKETLPFLIAYLLLTCQRMNPTQQERLAGYTVGALIGAYTIKLALAIWAGINNNWSFSIYEGAGKLPRYLDFFAADIIYYLPFLLAMLLFWPLRPMLRWGLAVVALLTLAFAFVSGVRTTFVFVGASLILIVFIRFWSRKGLLLLIVGVCIATGYFARNYITNPSVTRYYSIFSTETYRFGKDGSVTERQAIAKGVWEISKERIWLGYGSGWKKLPTVAKQDGHMARWKEGREPWHEGVVNYFSYGEGRVNPHNFYLMVLFEVGVLGLVAYLALLITLGWNCLRGLWRKNTTNKERGIYLGVLFYVGIYLGAGAAGGPWLPTTLVVAAVAVVLYRRSYAQNDALSKSR